METNDVLGELKLTSDGKLEGWCWCPSRPQERAVVEILLNGEVTMAFVAARIYSGLREHGYGDGYHGFSVLMPTLRPGLKEAIIEARERNSKTLIGRVALRRQTPQNIYGSRVQTLIDTVGAASAKLFSDKFVSPVSSYRGAFNDLGLFLKGLARSSEMKDKTHSEPALVIGQEILMSVRPIELPYLTAPDLTLILLASGSLKTTLSVIEAIRPALQEVAAELVLVNVSSDPLTALIGTRVRNLTYVFPKLRRGVSALNEGASVARGKRLFFCYETVLPNDILKAALSHEKLVLAGPLATDQARQLDLSSLFQQVEQADYEIGFDLCISKDIYRDIGGFDETLDDGSSIAMVDFLLKAYQQGRELSSMHAPRCPDGHRSMTSPFSIGVMKNRWGITKPFLNGN